jgi:hypothetical protein
VSDQETSGLTFDLAPDPAAAPTSESEQGLWGSLREVSGWSWVRLIPSLFRSMFAGPREPVGGLPIVEAGQTRPADLAEVDFGDSAAAPDYGLAFESNAAAQVSATGVGATAETSEPVRLAEAVAEVAEELGTDARSTGADAAEANVTKAAAVEATGNGHQVQVAASAADSDAVAELGEAGL